MDITQQYTIAYKGLKTGQHEFHFEVDDAFFQSFENAEITKGHCGVNIQMERAETQLDLQIQIDGEVVVPCDRCLDDCLIPIHFSGELVVRISNEMGEYDGEVMWVLPSEDEVDLAQYIYESVVLSLPYRRVHAEGECNPEMLKRFNIVTQEEFAAVENKAQSQHGADSPFAKLEALRQQMEEENK